MTRKAFCHRFVGVLSIWPSGAFSSSRPNGQGLSESRLQKKKKNIFHLALRLEWEKHTHTRKENTRAKTQNSVRKLRAVLRYSVPKKHIRNLNSPQRKVARNAV